MIYNPVADDDPIQQGDIFCNLPFVRFDLDRVKIPTSSGSSIKKPWDEVGEDKIDAIATVEKSRGIVLTQNCDCLREMYISLFLILPWNRNYQTPKNWMENIVKMNRKKDMFYLPLYADYDITERMYVDFSTVFQVKRENLKNYRQYRLCKLNDEALNHFREKISYYYKRYAFAEYYPLDKEEMDAYKDKNSESEEVFIRRQYQL